jgi:serine/threonine-protein kinase HipA
MNKQLDVYVLNHLAGHLFDVDNRYVFTYLPNTSSEYLVSLTMPVRAESYVWQRGLFPFFQQNLPEGYKKDSIRKRLGPHADVSDWGLLELTGNAGIGRVRIVPHGVSIKTEASHIDMAQILASPDSKERLLHYLNEGVLDGISGVMPKTMNRNEKTTIWTNDFILKTGTQNFEGLAINEYLCLETAKAAGLNVPQTALSEDGQVLAIARFDKQNNQRIAVEDFCSIKAYDPVNKYKLSLEELAALHNEYLAPENQHESAKQLYKLIVLNYALHNGDAHLKNFALTYTHSEDAFIAPVYDIVTTSAYPHLDDMPALTLQGKKAWWMGKQLRNYASTRLSLTQKEIDETEHSIHAAIDNTMPLILKMMAQFPYFKETGKRMIVEWTNGKNDITENAKKRTQSNNVVLNEMKLSEVKSKKKNKRAADSALVMKKF